MAKENLAQTIEQIASAVQGSATEVLADGTTAISVPQENLYAAAEKARAAGFNMMHSISGLDSDDHIAIVYHLFDTTDQNAIVLKAICPREGGAVATITPIWITADWHERETAELFGVEFTGHPDPRKLLIADDFPGYPLLKDWAYDDLEEYLLK